MPRDDDEDPSAPLDLGPEPARPVYPAAPAKPAAAPKAPAALRWGVCGVYHTAGELAGFPGEDGVIRYVTSGVTYTAPPLPGAWRSVPSEPGRYELPWAGDPAAARTLRHLRTDLERAARSGALADPDHPLLVELDAAGVGLATLAGNLHRQRWGLGLVQPDNVVVRGRDVTLTDLGFTWKGAFGNPPWDDSPGRPDWLDPAGPAAALWDHPPARQQFADPANGVFPPADPGADVRTLGRLLAWLISGQTGKVLPEVGGPDGPPPAWASVADAAAGRLPSADALAARLRANPLSEYFAPPPLADEPAPRTASPGGPNWVTPVALGLVLLMSAAGGGYYLLKGNKPELVPQVDVPEMKHASSEGLGDAAAAEGAREFDLAAALGSREGMFKGLRQLLDGLPEERHGEAGTRRAKAIDKWVADLNAAVTLAGDPTRRVEAARQFAALEAELKQLTETRPAADPAQQDKEQQCLAVAAEYARQFGPPRPPSP